MAEVLVEFESEFEAPDGSLYEARACAREREEDRLWEGWLEFTPLGGGQAVATARETTQPSRDTVLYWATGLTTTYIEGALHRTLTPAPVARVRDARTQPAYDRPAERGVSTTPKVNTIPILNPFQVYAEGADLLRGQLNALPDDQLRTIIAAHALSDPETANRANRQELISLIMVAVEKRAA